MLRLLNGYLLYPALEKLAKREISSKLKELKTFDRLPRVEQLSRQRQSIYEMASYCKNNIPFYKDMFNSISFEVEKLRKDVRYLEDLPLLTKEIVKEQTARIKSGSHGNLHARKTGGSTGESVYFFYDDEGLNWTAAINLLAYEMAGKKPYHSDCHSGAELGFGEPPFRDKIKLFAQNRSVLKVSSFGGAELRKSYEFLRNKKPFLLQAHPSTVYAIAAFMASEHLEPTRLCTVFEPTGEMLTQRMVSLIEKKLLCRVANRYGNAECGVMAHTKLGDNFTKMKVFEKSFYIELCTNSSIVVSCLTNFGFPLLRYDTGDVATVIQEEDGRYVTDIQGRVHELVTIANDVIPTHYIMDYLDHKVSGVREFQIVIGPEDSIPLLNIVPENPEDKDRIINLVKARWPEGLKVQCVGFNDLIKQGWRQKFKHLVDLRRLDEKN